ncbi:MAG: cation:proton antiporter [Gemmataceae bacterium]|nr:cation:proton antiporter [Gemmataceae bacterium]MCI0739466.1 cation:proton antiporter [Gemmataceae bacterium]
MHGNLELLLTLTGGLAAALAFGYVTHRLGLSPIVGYLLAGIAVGPNTPGFIANREIADQFAEVGVILLMFGVGLHFHIDELLAVRKIALPGAITQSLVATALGTATVLLFDGEWETGLVYGLAISVASTVVLIRVLVDNNDLHTSAGHIAVGWLVVEDLFTVVVLVLLPAFFGPEAQQINWLAALGLAVLKLSLLIAGVFLLGGRVIPWLLARVAATRSRELFTLTVLVVALGIAVGSAKFFGVSMALGAFLAGMVVGRSDFSLRAATEALPMRDAFAVLFFVSVGMLFDPRGLLDAPGLAIATLAIILIAKPLAALSIVLVLGYPARVAVAVAVALAQIGEFSFILAALGHQLGIVPDAVNNALVAAAILSISVNPLLYRLVDPFCAWAERQPRLGRWLRARAHPLPHTGASGHEDAMESAKHQAVIVGYGPVGKTLSRLLRDNEIEPTIVEMNLETMQRLREEGVRVVYGDATHVDTLRNAGVQRAGTLILSASAVQGAKEVIRLARELNPKIRLLVRTTYLRERTALEVAGATDVFSGEGEVALAMTESILSALGATAEQIERERERIRNELFGGRVAFRMLDPIEDSV